ncbi:MAG TPA: EamA family transporter RarD, partial [Aliiroseovarius sp.]|nr:EamA family transporter RarD [Aliiroseovarius sp.]
LGAHRVLWSVPVAGVALVLLGRTGDLRQALANPRMLAMAAVTAALVSVNWAPYVWAVSAGRALDGALGYYINPLFSVFLGAVLLGERLTRLQIVAIALAGVAVGVLAWEMGSLPWPALVLTLSWGFYAYFKRRLPIGPNQGFMLEVLLLSPVALAYLAWLASRGETHFFADSLTPFLLAGTGLATAIPLMLYANGAKGLRLSTIGMLQYIAPTMILLVAVFVFDEPFGRGRMIAFPMIWAALALYSFSLFQTRRKPAP